MLHCTLDVYCRREITVVRWYDKVTNSVSKMKCSFIVRYTALLKNNNVVPTDCQTTKASSHTAASIKDFAIVMMLFLKKYMVLYFYHFCQIGLLH